MESLIEEVKKNPALYDHRDDNFHDKQHKNNIWAQIATTLNYSNGAEAEQEWKKLVQKFRDAIEKHLEIDQPGERKWKHSQNMEFLLPFLVKKVESDENITKPSVVNIDAGDQSTNNAIEHHLGEDSPAQSESVNQIKKEKMDTDNIKEEIDTDEIELKPTISEHIQTEVKVEETELAISDVMAPTPDDELTSVLKCENVEFDMTASNASLMYNNESSFDEEEDDYDEEELETEDEDPETENEQKRDSLYHFFMSTYSTTKRMPEILQTRILNQISEALTETDAIMQESGMGENSE